MIDFPTIIEWFLFVTSVFSINAIFLLSLIAILTQKFQFFPPPKKQSWQLRTFMVLFRMFIYPLVGLSIFFFKPLEDDNALLQYGIGLILIMVGFGLAFWITFQMGWRNAFGEKHGLQTQGWFRISRNPVYVATWFGIIGWGLVTNSYLIWILLTLWAIMYIFAPFVEEPWLENEYGIDYLDYKKNTRRFI